MICAVSSMTVAKRSAFVLAFALGISLPSVASAAPKGAPSEADALFKEGRALLDAKNFDEACPKLAASQAKEPGAGTLLALALCHEGQGKTATAMNELREAAELGRRVGREDLARAADKRAQAMEPSLAKLVVRMPEGARYDVACDGQTVEPSRVGEPFMVDPGEHKVKISARGKKARTYTVRLSGAGLTEIVVDPLEAEAAAVAPPAPARRPAKIVTLTTEPPAPEAADTSRGGAQRVIGLTVAGLGIAGLGAGAYFGGRALSESSSAKKGCTPGPCPEGQTNDANERAKSAFSYSVVSIAAGTGALAIGTILYFTAPRSGPRAAAAKPKGVTARVIPEAGPRSVGLGVVGTF
jgi:hypothetical protein